MDWIILVIYLIGAYLSARWTAGRMETEFGPDDWEGIDTAMCLFFGFIWPIAVPAIAVITCNNKDGKRPRWLGGKK